MTKSVTVTRDRVDAVLEGVRSLTKTDVMVGIPESATKRDGSENGEQGSPITNAAIGFINETGSPKRNIPARPHLAPGVKEASQKIVAQFKGAARAAIEGDQEGVTKRLNAVGLIAVSSVKAMITAVLSPALSPVTLYKRKHRSVAPRTGETPLIDTGDYLKHITYVLRERGRK